MGVGGGIFWVGGVRGHFLWVSRGGWRYIFGWVGVSGGIFWIGGGAGGRGGMSTGGYLF